MPADLWQSAEQRPAAPGQSPSTWTLRQLAVTTETSNKTSGPQAADHSCRGTVRARLCSQHRYAFRTPNAVPQHACVKAGETPECIRI